VVLGSHIVRPATGLPVHTSIITATSAWQLGSM
jgi:hypothetical protein